MTFLGYLQLERNAVVAAVRAANPDIPAAATITVAATERLTLLIQIDLQILFLQIE